MRTVAEHLEGVALDWSVLMLESNNEYRDHFSTFMQEHSLGLHRYSTMWHFGGPVIDQARICIIFSKEDAQYPIARIWDETIDKWHEAEGQTSLIAAMRCYVKYKVGDEIEVPDALFEE